MRILGNSLLPFFSLLFIHPRAARSGKVYAKSFASVNKLPSGVTKYGYGHCEIFAIPMFQDNYGYVLRDKSSQLCAVIDPGESKPIIESVRKLNLDLRMILVTHKHADHAGGNIEIRNEYPSIDVIATSYEEVPGMTSPVKHGDSIFLGSLAIRVIHSPCHTRGHVLYYVTGNDQSDGPPILFSGDTLFVGGCGRFFEGTAEDMLKNMDTISTLPPETQVFCAHEYTESNLKFLATLDSELCSADLSRIQGLRRDGMPTIPTTVEAERRYNLFMKCREARVQELLGCSGSAVDTMAKLRKLKNAF